MLGKKPTVGRTRSSFKSGPSRIDIIKSHVNDMKLMTVNTTGLLTELNEYTVIDLPKKKKIKSKVALEHNAFHTQGLIFYQRKVCHPDVRKFEHVSFYVLHLHCSQIGYRSNLL